MPNLLSNNYLSRKPIEKAMQEFAKNFSSNQKVLDIGCGNKPYAKYFSCQYIGLDPCSMAKADITAEAWNIPMKDDELDGIILNQSLEHIEKINETISEIKRILRPGGICIITAPQTMRNHSCPIPSEKIILNNFDKNKIKFFNVDYFRFTKFGLICLFKDFKILELRETSGYFGTIIQLINYFLAIFRPIKIILSPVHLILNIMGLALDGSFSLIKNFNIKTYNKFYELMYLSLTLNYIMIIKKQ